MLLRYLVPLLLFSSSVYAANPRMKELAIVGAVVFVTSTAIALWITARKKLTETPVKILVFGAWFWILVFIEAIGYAVIKSLL